MGTSGTAGLLACVKIYDLKSNGKLLYEKKHLTKERGQNVPWCLVGIINPCAVVTLQAQWSWQGHAFLKVGTYSVAYSKDVFMKKAVATEP